MSDEVTLYEANPSMFRNAPVLFVLSCLLCVVGVGAVILLVWWLKCKGTTLIVTNEGVTLKKGILSKSMNELWHEDIQNVQVDQTFFQRLLDVGTVGLSSGGQAGIEITVHGIPHPHEVHRLIEEQRRAMRRG